MKANRIQVFSVAAILGTDCSIFYENYESRGIRSHVVVICSRVIYHQTTSPHVTMVLYFVFYYMAVTFSKLKSIIWPLGFEPCISWSGVRRSTTELRILDNLQCIFFIEDEWNKNFWKDFRKSQCIELNFYNWKQQRDDSSNCKIKIEEIYRAVFPK